MLFQQPRGLLPVPGVIGLSVEVLGIRRRVRRDGRSSSVGRSGSHGRLRNGRFGGRCCIVGGGLRRIGGSSLIAGSGGVDLGVLAREDGLDRSESIVTKDFEITDKRVDIIKQRVLALNVRHTGLRKGGCGGWI